MSDLPPWPFPPPKRPPPSKPTWACPEGLCACHPTPGEVELAPHTIVFHDPYGVRMPFARCMVYEQGRAITSPTTAANEVGELEIELRPETKNVLVAWCPPADLHDKDEPYEKVYHVEVDPDPIRRRLDNAGFAGRENHRDNIRDYQGAYAQPETGEEQDIAADLTFRHDEGGITPFVPRPDVEPAATATNDDELASALRTQGTFDDPPKALFGDGTSSAAKAKQGQGKSGGSVGQGAGQGSQGVLVPNATQLWLVVGLEPEGPIKAKDVTVQVMKKGQDRRTKKPKLISPTVTGLQLPNIPDRFVICVFVDLPLGTYHALAHVKNVKGVHRKYALGREEIVVARRPITLRYVALTRERAILLAHDPLLELEVDAMQRRRKVLATLFVSFPQSADKSTAPANFPPYQQRAYKAMTPGLDATNTCAPINVEVMNDAGAVGPQFGFGQGKQVKDDNGIVRGVKMNPGFFKYKVGSAPSVGDSFLQTNSVGNFKHCGTVVQSSATYGDLWFTADGGQPDRTTDFIKQGGEWGRFYEPPPSREGAYVVPRAFTAAGTDRAQLGNRFLSPGVKVPGGYYVSGWTDVTHPSVRFRADYTADIRDEHFRAMVKLLLEIGPRVREDIRKSTDKERKSP